MEYYYYYFYLLLFIFSIIPSDQSHFPDCQALDQIQSIFNIFQWLYLEVKGKEGLTYFRFDTESERYIKTDWLYSLSS